ncbi:MAG: radical SAM protein [Candidatus Adiutrix sp.]|nr:radical SAM protein [Candidatus Adiutrix sp.]
MNISYLILILTTRCNLACKYCYNGDQAGEDMTPATIKNALNLAAGGSGPLHIQFTGGEPTLAPDLMAYAADEARRLGRETHLAVQTNGTLLTPPLAAFFREYEFQVGLSLDGPAEINEKTRGGSAAVFQGMRLLDDFGLDFNVTAVVNETSVHYLSRLPLILAGFSHARGFGLDLLIKKGRNQAETAKPGHLASSAHKIKRALAAVNRRRRRPLLWRELELLENCRPGAAKDFCHACRNESLAVRPDGRAYPCGQTSGSNEFLLGNATGLSALKTPLTSLKLAGSDCRDCIAHGRCPGECPSRLYYNQGREAFLICELYQALASI